MVSATGADNGPSALSYQWSIASGGGSLANANTATPVYTPPVTPGSYTIYLDVVLSDGEANQPYTLPLTITVQ